MQIVIYTKENCIYCKRVKKLCNDRELPYKELLFKRDFDRKRFFELFPHADTFPQVVVDGKHIGGADDFEKWLAFDKMDDDF